MYLAFSETNFSLNIGKVCQSYISSFVSEFFSAHQSCGLNEQKNGKANTAKLLSILNGARSMTEANKTELEGITLATYLYAVKKNKPVGPRDVMKGVKLSSPSVAYRHLQKLEDMGYLAKNEYGEYTLKRRASIRGYVWLGRRLTPKLWLYALAFLAIIAVELVIFGLHFSVETPEFETFFILLMLITGAAFAVFAVEGYLLNRRSGKIIAE